MCIKCILTGWHVSASVIVAFYSQIFIQILIIEVAMAMRKWYRGDSEANADENFACC